MSVSLVVALRWAGVPPRDAAQTSRVALDVRSAIERASVGGGRLVGVVADGASFGFDDDTLEEAIELAIAYVHDRPDGHPRWKVGVGYGELVAVREEEAFERLSIGPAAARASSLARIAQAGEVLVDLAIPEAGVGALLSTGRRVATDGARGRFRGLVLDDAEPWRRGGAESVEKIRTPAVIGREAAFSAVAAVMPGGLGVLRASPGMGGSRFFEELTARTARSLLVVPAGCSVEPLGALRIALQRALERCALRPAGGRDVPALSPRADAALRRLLEGLGVDIDTASQVVGEWLRADAPDETPLLLVDDAMSVDRASLEAIGLAACAAGASFAVIARLESGDVVPSALSGLVVEADLALKALQPHEAAAMLEDACGGEGGLTPEVKKRWTRRGGAIPLAVMESLRHGLMVGELALRNGVVTPRSKTAGRGRTLSPQAWVTRRFAALALDRPADATIATVVSIAGAQLPRRRLGEVASDLGLPTGTALDDIVARLCREGVLECDGDRVSTSSRTLHDVAIERSDEPMRRRLHGALAAAFAQTARGLDLAEGAHHAALAGDHLGAASLATRAADRARHCGLDEWADALANFARAEGAPGPLATTPSPPPRAASRAPKVSSVPSEAPVDLEPFEDPRNSPMRMPVPAAAPAEATVAAPPQQSSAPQGPPKPRPPPPKPALSPRITTKQHKPAIDTSLTTGQIAALPSPSFAKMLVAKEAAREASVALSKMATPQPPVVVPAPRAAPPRPAPPRPPPKRSEDVGATIADAPLVQPRPAAAKQPEVLDADATTEYVARPLPDPDEPPPLAADELAGLEAPMATVDSARVLVADATSAPPPTIATGPGVATLADDARRALAARDLGSLEAVLAQLEAVGGSPCAIARLRGLSAVARGDLGGGFRLLRRARADAKSEREIARGSLAYAIALGAAGRREDALLEALSALARERKLQPRPSARGDGSDGDRACRRLIARLLEGAPAPGEASAPA